MLALQGRAEVEKLTQRSWLVGICVALLDPVVEFFLLYPLPSQED